MARAYYLEQELSKSQILELYLNLIFLGDRAYGVQVASNYYFSKNAKDLTLAESAFLAGINDGPNYYNAFSTDENDINKINELGAQLHSNFIYTYHIETEVENSFSIVLVSEDNSIITGYLYAQELVDNIDLLSIFVDKNYRYQHIGTDLINYLQEKSNNKTITLEVSNKNENAILLYKKCGFKVVGIRKKYYIDSDAIVMKWGI